MKKNTKEVTYEPGKNTKHCSYAIFRYSTTYFRHREDYASLDAFFRAVRSRAVIVRVEHEFHDVINIVKHGNRVVFAFADNDHSFELLLM